MLTPEQGGGSLAGAVTSREDGRMHSLLRFGQRPNATLVVRSDKVGGPLEVQAVTCSPTGCEVAQTLKSLPGKPNRYRLEAPDKKARRSAVDMEVHRASDSRLDIAITGMSSQPHVLHYYGERGLVTMGQEATPSLMRGGTKTRVGRSHGYGIFAVEDIKAGEVVEEAPILSQATPFLANYTFSSGDKHILPLGNIALYNHSDTPNCTHSLNAGGDVMTLTATRDIRAGEQCSISYGGSQWFTSRGMTPSRLD